MIAFYDLIEVAEKKSEITCEKCEKSGIIRSGNWLC